MVALTTTAPTPLALAAYRPEWKHGELAEVSTVEQVDEALAEVDRWMVPIRDRDRRFASVNPEELAKAISQSEDAREMVDAIKMIGRQVRPDFSPSQAAHFLGGVVAGLVDLPPHVAREACKAAITRGFEFPGQVLKGIREESERVAERYRLARLRLENLRREIERAGRPALPPPPPAPPMTQEQVDRMANASEGSIHRTLLSMAIGCGLVIEVDGKPTLNPDPPQEETPDE